MRLKWRCHFIQKFEVEYTYEIYCVNRDFELIEKINNQDHLDVWKKAQIGFPLIDSCMRSIQKVVWINFCMRGHGSLFSMSSPRSKLA